jgi:hypothetical protein
MHDSSLVIRICGRVYKKGIVTNPTSVTMGPPPRTAASSPNGPAQVSVYAMKARWRTVNVRSALDILVPAF